MKIALFNWAPIHGNFDEGGGAGIYLKNIAHALSERGHDVTVLSSGFFYDLTNKNIFLRRHIEKNSNIRYIDIINSRVIAPAYAMFHNIELCMHEESTKNAVRTFLLDCGPFDILHIQNIEGIPFSTLELRSEFPNTKFILSNHNYHAICQQVNLWYNEESSCGDYYDGIACYSCMTNQIQFPHFFAIRALTTRFNRKLVPDDQQSIINFIMSYKELDLTWFNDFRIYDKSFDKRSIDLYGKNKFFYRRHKAVQLINDHIDHILSVSECVEDIVVKYGMDPRKSIVSYIGTRHFSGTFERKKRFDPEKLNICFMGYARKDKGFYFLLDAFSNMPTDLHGKLSLTFAGKIENEIDLNRLRSLERYLSGITIVKQYTHADIPLILSTIDIGVVPPLWYDALPQVAIEFVCNGVPILVSDKGGQKEIINHDDFVFTGGDIQSFWNRIRKILFNPNSIDEFWDAGVRVYSMEGHIDNLLSIYHVAPPARLPTVLPSTSQSPPSLPRFEKKPI
ncbi:glycosyltransferase family 4 protein [Gluconacetobacter sacchari]|uniref:glycosyltransferase family 4 protein n=1 Tax=Gluconacetobacter sacchari TaxID=92759 RepID=UPI0039B5868E